MDEILKENIRRIVRSYEKQYPEEVASFDQQMKVFRSTLLNQHASLKGDHVQERELFRIPETLDTAFRAILSDEQRNHIWGNGEDAKKHAFWFAREFPRYRVPLTL